MYNKIQVIDYLKKYGWNKNRNIDTFQIRSFYNHFFDGYRNDDYETFIFKPYPTFQKVIDFWSSFGDLTIDFIAPNNSKGRIVITTDAILNEGIHDIIQTSMHYNIKIFPVAMVEIVPCFLCIDEKGYFYGINYCGGVNHFTDDFLKVVDILINNKSWPKWDYFPELE